MEQRALHLRAAGVPGTLPELRVRAYLDLLRTAATPRPARTHPAAARQAGPGQQQIPPSPPGTADRPARRNGTATFATRATQETQETHGANIAYGAGYGLLGALISAWPAVAFIGSVEVAMQQVRRARASRAATSGPAVPEVPGDVEQAVRAAYAASVAAGSPLSQRAMAERFGLSRRWVSQLIAQVTASGNGHLPGSEAA